MSIRGMGRLRGYARGLRNRFRVPTVILLYHRVADLSSDPQLLCVSPQNFADQLRMLQRYARPMRLRELNHSVRKGSWGRYRVILTFDDGYADNLHYAKPTLKRYGVPATVFVATGHIGSGRGFWKDRLERVLLQPGTLPKTLSLNIGETSYRWEIGEATNYSKEDFNRYSCWNVASPNDPTMRHQLYRTLCQLLRRLSERDRWRVLDELVAWAGLEPEDFSSHRTLSTDELIQLAEGGLVEIGSHTVSHPVLSSLQVDEQRREIEGSKQHLENVLRQTISSFAYPYGRRSDYTAETVSVVREAGFELACSNFAGIVHRDADMWQLPRFLVRDWDGLELASRLKEWLRS